MPRRVVLSASQRQAFETLPVDQESLVQYYTLSEEDLSLIKRCRLSRNRLGFALQLCLIRYPGRALRSNEDVPQPLIKVIAEQTGDDADDFHGYAQRDETRREHLSFLVQHLQLSVFGRSHAREVIRWLIPTAIENPKSVFLIATALDKLRQRRILHPPLAVVERIVATAQSHADLKVCKRINSGLDATHNKQLDAWLTKEPDKTMSRLSWVRQPVGRPSPGNVLIILKRIEAIRQLNLPSTIWEAIPNSRRQQLRREGNRASIQHLRTFNDDRRYATVAIFLLETQRALVDEALAMHDRLIGALMRRGQRKHAEQFQEDAGRIKLTIKVFSSLGKALIRAKEAGEDPWPIIEEDLSWAEFCTAVKDAESLSEPRRFDALYYIETNYHRIRRYAPALLEHFDFHAATGGQDVLDALELLREMNRTGKRKLPLDAPTSFVSPRWQPYVFRDEGIDRRYYELCALTELRNRLRSGDVWMPGSRQYQDFDSYLLDKKAFQQLLDNDAVPVAVSTDFSDYMTQRTKQLRLELSDVQNLMKHGHLLEDVEIKQGKLSIKPYRGVPIPDAVRRFTEQVYAQVPRIKITELLVEVDTWTRFTEQFTHLSLGRAPKDKQALLTVILADGINLGLTRMAEACPGISLNQLRRTADWCVRDECYRRALAELVNYHHQTKLVGSWGTGTTSSSDGQQFPLGSTGKALGEVNARYGRGPGTIFYTHISDQYSPFHSKLINATIRDATYVLDGLLYHESDIQIAEHYTDTEGFTDHVFALCHLLGFRFAPRIRDIGDKRLYMSGEKKDWPELASLFGDRLKIKEIETQWKDVLRLASSIRLGTVTASLIIRKLASYPRQNRLALAVRELGRLERTLFILDWMKNPTLRGRVQAGLNKGEARNALARAVFFNRLGEVRDRSFENQSHHASGLNLVVAAIILWNTAYLERILEKMRKEMAVPDEYLRYLSPLGWEHVGLTGDYVWKLNP